MSENKCKQCGIIKPETEFNLDTYAKVFHGIEYRMPICTKCNEKRADNERNK